jgi:hypothetical protein
VPTTFRRCAPVFVTSDLGSALVHYAKLGFAVQAYDGGDVYGYARRDDVEIHLAGVEHLDPATTTSCAYL